MVDKRFVAIIVLILTWVFFAYYTVWIFYEHRGVLLHLKAGSQQGFHS